jgi:hypothetical protein
MRTAESRRDGTMVMTIQEARDLHNDITRLLLRLEQQDATAPDRPTLPETIEIRGRPFR